MDKLYCENCATKEPRRVTLAVLNIEDQNLCLDCVDELDLPHADGTKLAQTIASAPAAPAPAKRGPKPKAPESVTRAAAVTVIAGRQCACDCGSAISDDAWERGWRYARGHKPNANKSGQTAKPTKVGTGAKRGPKPKLKLPEPKVVIGGSLKMRFIDAEEYHVIFKRVPVASAELLQILDAAGKIADGKHLAVTVPKGCKVKAFRERVARFLRANGQRKMHCVMNQKHNVVVISR